MNKLLKEDNSMELNGSQSIGCSVVSCKHNQYGGKCGLKQIQVTPLSNVVETPEESMCQSFERKQY